MSVPLRTLIALLLFGLAALCLQQAKALQLNPDPDSTKVVFLFIGVLFSGAIGAGLLVSVFLPWLGDGVGNFFFNPNQRSEPHPHARALAAVARGDYAAAAAEYQRVAAETPEDTLAVSEASRLYCEKLHDCDAAAALLEEALSRDWLPEDAAFLSLRLADVYWTHQRDAPRAREMLMQVMNLLPGTKHAANAGHKLQEMERQVAMGG